MYKRVFNDIQTFERNNAVELNNLIIQKEKEGWEVIKPFHRVEKLNLDGSSTRTKFAVGMKLIRN